MLTMKDIIIEPNPLLRMKAKEVTLPIQKEDVDLINELSSYIFNSIDEVIQKEFDLRPAVGIAAPQIGILKRMFSVYCIDEDGKEHFLPVINPKIIKRSNDLIYLPGGEGCLSVAREVKGYIHRSKEISVDTFILTKNNRLRHVTLHLSGYVAIVFQHEYDHLDGILFVDKVNNEDPFFIPENSKPVIFGSNETKDAE